MDNARAVFGRYILGIDRKIRIPVGRIFLDIRMHITQPFKFAALNRFANRILPLFQPRRGDNRFKPFGADNRCKLRAVLVVCQTDIVQPRMHRYR